MQELSDRQKRLLEACKKYNIEIMTHRDDGDYIIKILNLQYKALKRIAGEEP